MMKSLFFSFLLLLPLLVLTFVFPADAEDPEWYVIRKPTKPAIVALARFAVEEHNRGGPGHGPGLGRITFARMVRAQKRKWADGSRVEYKLAFNAQNQHAELGYYVAIVSRKTSDQSKKLESFEKWLPKY